MKPKNFPARRLRRQLVAQKKIIDCEESWQLLQEAREIRTKKRRTK
jgi:hypothetical protein